MDEKTCVKYSFCTIFSILYERNYYNQRKLIERLHERSIVTGGADTERSKTWKAEITKYDTNNTVFYLSVFHIQSMVFTQWSIHILSLRCTGNSLGHEFTEWYNWRQIKGSAMLFFGTTSPSRGPLVQGWTANHKRNRRYLSLRGREREKWRENSLEHASSSTGTWRAGRILQVQCKKQYSKQRVFWDTDDIWM